MHSKTAAHQVPQPSKARVLMRKARGVDAYWTYVRLRGTQRVRFRNPLKRGFSSARRTGAMCTGVHELLWNAADEVPQPSKARVLMRKARDADVYWSTLGIAERSASGSATYTA